MWLRRCGLVKVLPLQTFRRHLVHHATNAIVRSPTRLRQFHGLVRVEDFLNMAEARVRRPREAEERHHVQAFTQTLARLSNHSHSVGD